MSFIQHYYYFQKLIPFPSARKAIHQIVKQIARGSDSTCLLGLFLMDILVMNGEYPVHSVLNDRMFLNLFVYRLPSGPSAPNNTRSAFTIGEDGNPTRYTKAQLEILKLISKWIVTFCEKHPLKGNFGNLRLMAALLKSKQFPLTRPTPQEIEAILPPNKRDIDERLVQESKLEFLLHSGKESDLRKANQLMKEMVLSDGFDGSDGSINENENNENKTKILLQIDRGHELCARFESLLLGGTDGSQIFLLEELKEELAEVRKEFELLLCDEVLGDSDLMAKILSCNERINDLLNSGNVDEVSLIDLDDDDNDNDNGDGVVVVVDNGVDINQERITLSPSTSTCSIISNTSPFKIEGSWVKDGDFLMQLLKTTSGKSVFLLSNLGDQDMFCDCNTSYSLRYSGITIVDKIPPIKSYCSIVLEIVEMDPFVILQQQQQLQEEPEIIQNYL